MAGIWLDNPNKPQPSPFTVVGLIQGDPAYYFGNALLAISTKFTIINDGTLASPTVVVNLNAGGDVTNQSNATITGIQAGVLITKSGSVTNQTGGLISAAMTKS